MENKKEKKLQFTIDGKDFKNLIKFQQEHENCLDKYPNMSCGHYSYSFSVDGFGIMKSVTCICGKTIYLDGDYNFGFGDECMAPKNRFQITPEDRATSEIVKLMMAIKKRPGLYFGTNRSYKALRSLIYGFEIGVRVMELEDTCWRSMDTDINNEVRLMISDKELSDEELFDIYLSALERVLYRDYPLFMEKLGFSPKDDQQKI